MVNNISAVLSVEQMKLGIRLVGKAPSKLVRTKGGRGNCRTKFLPYLAPHLVTLPADLSILLPYNHLAHSIMKAVRQLDLTGILAKYEGKCRVGRSAYDPVMMLTLILYCYCEGQTSTRAIEKMARENIPCRVITGGRTPDHDTIASFLATHRDNFDSIFQQVLEIVDRAGLVKLDHVAVDGSKVKANASKHKAMSHGRMRKEVTRLRKEINELKRQLHWMEKRADCLAAKASVHLRKEIEFKQARLAKIQEFKQKLEERVRAQALVKEKSKTRQQGGRGNLPADPRKAKPKPSDQISFTDEESRIMPCSGGQFEQCYNAQIVVDSHAQIIVAYDVVQDTNDKRLLVSMLAQAQKRTGMSPKTASADAGYFSEQSLKSKVAESIELLVPPDRECHPRKTVAAVGRIPANLSVADRMRRKLSTTKGKKTYAMRKCIVEPVYGQIKQSVLHFNQFSLRGLQNVRNEWALVCTAHNLLKLHRSGCLLKPPELSAA